jgi:hypothetical protein
MQLNSRIVFLVALFALALFSSCGKQEKATPPEELIAKSWKLDRLELQNEIVGPELMATASFTFYKNGRYEILMGDLERGKWTLSANKKVLITTEDGAATTGEMDIVTLTPTKLVLTNNGNETPMRMELVPIQ